MSNDEYRKLLPSHAVGHLVQLVKAIHTYVSKRVLA